MSRYTPNDLTGALAPINPELEKIKLAIDDTLSRKNDTPNSMQGNLDMNSQRILNLPEPVGGTEPLRKKDSEIGSLIEYTQRAEAAEAGAEQAEADAVTAKNAAQAAQTAAELAETNAETAETNAELAEAGAEAAQAAAETAADVAMAAGWVYTTVAAGEADRVDGDYFWVVSANDSEVLELWLMGAATATDTGKRTLSTQFPLVDFSGISFEQGAINTFSGADSASSVRIRTNLYSALYLEITAGVGQQINVFFYNDDGSYIDDSGFGASYPLTRINSKFRIVVKNIDESPILSSESLSVISIDSWSKQNAKLTDAVGTKPTLNSDGRLDEIYLTKKVLEDGSAIESWSGYQPDQLVSLQIWDRDAGDSFYLNTLYRYFFLAASSTYAASVGFKRVSDNRHIAPSLSPQTNPALFAFWTVTEAPSGIQSYYLYVDGSDANPPVGMVTVNWDLIPATNTRYIGTNGLSPVITANLGKTVQDTKFARLNEVQANYWNGKKIVGLGDSITYGFVPRNDPDYPGQLQSWLPLVAGKLGMSFVNYGISGSTLANLGNGTRNPFTERYDSMDNDADLIVVMGGTNDFRNGIPLGEFTDSTDLTFYGALHVLCEGLIDKYYIQQGLELGKEKQILFMTPIKIQDPSTGGLDTDIEPFVAAIKEVCAYYSIPVFDSYNLSGITPHILQTVVGTDPGYTGNYNPYITDGTHPNQEGHDKWAGNIAGFISALRE
jgi:lysophospholipase L1-like esterase